MENTINIKNIAIFKKLWFLPILQLLRQWKKPAAEPKAIKGATMTGILYPRIEENKSLTMGICNGRNKNRLKKIILLFLDIVSVSNNSFEVSSLDIDSWLL